jgi:FMN phosphatase YigB (HAD superfamily)
MSRIEAIDAIIFDLGGVIIDIRYEATIEAFSALCGWDVSTIYTQQAQTPLFDSYEMGKISSSDFRDGLRNLLNIDVPDRAIDDAWNAMLLDIPPERVDLLKRLKQQRRIFLLSNTNEIHKAQFDRIFLDQYGAELSGISDLFERVYFSHEMGDRKPNPSIFQTVIDDQLLDPARTLFIDDTRQHIDGAQKIGLQAIHYTGSDLSLLPL